MTSFSDVAISFLVDSGLDGVVDDSANNPLYRALATLFAKGKPFPKLANTFFVGQDDVLRWFGVFVESDGGRIVFFPGFSSPVRKIEGNTNTNAEFSAFEFDHISLERDRRTFHVTSALSAKHVKGPATLALEDGVTLWVGLSAENEKCFRPVAQESRLLFRSPRTDAERRRSLFQKAIKGQITNTIRLTPDKNLDSQQFFLHFAIYVGKASAKLYEGVEICAPLGNPYLTKALPQHLQTQLRLHRVPLSTTSHVQVTACRMPGGLSSSFALTGPIAGQAVVSPRT